MYEWEPAILKLEPIASKPVLCDFALSKILAKTLLVNKQMSACRDDVPLSEGLRSSVDAGSRIRNSREALSTLSEESSEVEIRALNSLTKLAD
jgi:hypothetical protein